MNLKDEALERLASLKTDKRKIKEQWVDYLEEVDLVIKPGIKNAKGPLTRMHKRAAYIEEFVDINTRVTYLSLFVLVPLALYGAVVLVGKVF